MKVVLNSLETKGPGTSFHAAFFIEFFDENISFDKNYYKII